MAAAILQGSHFSLVPEQNHRTRKERSRDRFVLKLPAEPCYIPLIERKHVQSLARGRLVAGVLIDQVLQRLAFVKAVEVLVESVVRQTHEIGDVVSAVR